MKVTKILVKNPYTEDEYETTEVTKDRFNHILEDIQRGNEQFVKFHTLDGVLVTISPAYCAQIDVWEAEK